MDAGVICGINMLRGARHLKYQIKFYFESTVEVFILKPRPVPGSLAFYKLTHVQSENRTPV